MFERFEPAARQAFLDARQEAHLAGQHKVRSEHLLLGLLREPGLAAELLIAAGLDPDSLRSRLPRGRHDLPAGLDADALSTLGIDLDAVRRATDAAFGPGALDLTPVPGGSGLRAADDTRQALSGAVRQAHAQGQREISSGHLLLGILDQKSNGALAILTATGTDIPALRADTKARLTAAA
jgi:ATP-dependent Clp protease ATP-binding subunit ClpA